MSRLSVDMSRLCLAESHAAIVYELILKRGQIYTPQVFLRHKKEKQ